MTDIIQQTGPADNAMRAVRVNEREMTVALGTGAFALRDRVKPDADIVIYNGFPLAADRELEEGDALVLIRRGEVPGQDEMETLLTARRVSGSVPSRPVWTPSPPHSIASSSRLFMRKSAPVSAVMARSRKLSGRSAASPPCFWRSIKAGRPAASA